MGKTRYLQAKMIVAAAKKSPEEFGDLPAMMDRTGNVGGTFKELLKRQGKKPKKKPNPEAAYVPTSKRQKVLAASKKRQIMEGLPLSAEDTHVNPAD